MTRAEITTIEDGKTVTREVESASYDDDGLLYIHGNQAYSLQGIINMKAPTFCSVHFLPEAV